MKYILGLLLCITSICLQAQSKITYLKMERTPCFGRCPVYTIELNSDGTIVYEGKKNVDVIGKRKSKITTAQMNKFFKQFAKYKIASLQNTYKPRITDISRMYLTMLVNGKTKSIKNGESGPKYLETIGNKVDSLMNTINWEKAKEVNEDDGSGPQLNLDVTHDQKVIVAAEAMPEFPGGEAALMKFIKDNLKYPNKAKDEGIEGKVVCHFTVTKMGKVSNIVIVKGLGGGCNEEAMRVIRMMPDWKPGMQLGKKVDVEYTLPIKFQMN